MARLRISVPVLLVLFAAASASGRHLRADSDEGCFCPALWAPVCEVATNRTFGNPCNAACAHVPENATQPGECPGPQTPPTCICTMEYAPVCDTETNHTYGNRCAARCAGVPANRTAPGECPPRSCICFLLYDPVCDTTTGKTYGNSCQAACEGASNATTPGECPSPKASPSPVRIGNNPVNPGRSPVPVPSPAPCICTRDYRPVCDTLTGRTYSNPCTARCANVTGVRLLPGQCSSGPKKCASRCPKNSNNIASYDPLCVISRTTLNTTETNTVSYFNPCIAQCYANQRRVLGSYKGVCNATADAQCANRTRAGILLCSSSFAAEYPTQCYAEALDPAGARVVTYAGQCVQPEAAQLAGSCPPVNPITPEPTTNCLVDPCQLARCATPNATCVSRYCPGFFRTTFLSGICQAVWIDTAGNIDTACTFGNATSTTSTSSSTGSSRAPSPTPSPLPCCPPVARPGDGPCTDCGLRGKL